MQQEIQIKLHMSVSINAKYDEKELAEIVKRNIGFKNNRTYIHSLSFIEERGIYSDEELSQWNTIYEKEDVRTKDSPYVKGKSNNYKHWRRVMGKETLKMSFKEFQQAKMFLTLSNYDNESVQGYSYYEGWNDIKTTPSKYCEEHHWISKIGEEYHLILCNADFLDSDLEKLEKMLYEFIYVDSKMPIT